MTEKYLIFPTEKEALDRSAQAWADVLGRAPKPGDVTRYLWPVRVNPKDGSAALVIPDTPDKAGITKAQAAYDALSTAKEKTDAVAVLPKDFDPAPIDVAATADAETIQ